MDIFTEYGVEVKRLALTESQVDQYGLPPNPAKLNDSRSKGYMKQYGRSSWELDAIEITELEQLMSDEVERHIDDQDNWKRALDKQEDDQEKLGEVYRQFKRDGN